MKSRLWNRSKDYDTLVRWWQQWEFGVVPEECLPPDGVIVEHEGKPVCAGGLYIGLGTQLHCLLYTSDLPTSHNV